MMLFVQGCTTPPEKIQRVVETQQQPKPQVPRELVNKIRESGKIDWIRQQQKPFLKQGE